MQTHTYIHTLQTVTEIKRANTHASIHKNWTNTRVTLHTETEKEHTHHTHALQSTLKMNTNMRTDVHTAGWDLESMIARREARPWIPSIQYSYTQTLGATIGKVQPERIA